MRRKGIKFFCGIMVTFFCTLVLAGCGGDDGSDPPAGVSYTGNTGAAVIDANMGSAAASELAVSAFEGGASGDPLNGTGYTAALQTAGGGSQAGSSQVQDVARALKGALDAADLSTASASNAAALIPIGSESIPGTCPGAQGEYILSASMDSVTMDILGTMTFNSYCDQDVTLSGVVNFTFPFPIDQNIQTLTMSFGSLTASSAGQSVSMGGTMAFTSDSTYSPAITDTVVMNMVLLDNGAQQTFKLENYTIVTIDDGSGSGVLTVKISGRFYHHVYGYVDIGSPLDINSPAILTIDTAVNPDLPNSGEILFQGASDGIVLTFTGGAAAGALDSDPNACTFNYPAI